MAQNDDNAERAAEAAGSTDAQDDDLGRSRIFSLGENGGVPLAAVFKTRKPGRRRRRPSEAPSSAPAPEVTPEAGEGGDDGAYDVVLTDAFRVEESTGPASGATPETPPPAVEAPREIPPPAAEAPAAEAATGDAQMPSTPPPAAREPSPPPAPAPPPAPTEPVLEPQQKAPPPTLPELVPPDADPVWARDALLSLAGDYLKQHRTPTERAWFAEVFRAAYLKAHPVRGDATTRAEVDFIETRLGAVEGARLLDVACGYGRHSLELARRGHEMVGLDLSLDMLKRALATAQEEGLAVKFVHGDMRDLNFDQVFDGVLSFDTSFGFFSDAENIAVLRSLHRALKRGGRLVIDVLNRDYAIQSIPNRNWWEGDGCLVQEDIEYDHVQSRLRIKRFLVYADGTQRDYDISLRLYGPHELARALEFVGFEIVDISGSVHSAGAFFGAFSPRVVITARRRND